MLVRVALLVLAMAGCTPKTPEALPAPSREPSPGNPVVLPLFSYEFSNFMGGDPDADSPKPSSVYVKISKNDPDHGAVSWSKIHREGLRLGVDDNGQSVHLVHSTKRGRSVEVDFDTGISILRIQIDKLVPHSSRRCPILIEPMVECSGPVKKFAPYRVHEIQLILPTGQTEVSTHVAGSRPEGDLTCRRHGGDQDPPVWTEEQVRKLREDTAEDLLFQSNGGWLSKNPKVRRSARDGYARLLKEFAETQAVIRNRERIATRAAAEIEE